MSTPYFVVSVLAAMVLVSANAQTAADLFQKGIHAQETAGDLDGAIQIFRQVAADVRNRALAAQAQFQLVLCMLQKGDRSAASKELDALARNFPEQPDLFAKARQLIPGSAALLPAPWGEGDLAS
jgi:outer membrane protein assembly factor BamD (BamD/ComL family)